MSKISWQRYEPGTWLPKDRNAFHNCALFVAAYGETTVQAHRTKDARHWVASARAERCRVPEGGVFRTRIGAFWDAVDRLRREVPIDRALSQARGEGLSMSDTPTVPATDEQKLHGPGRSPRDWPEDFPHENGTYLGRCAACDEHFWGYKRRPVCKACFLARVIAARDAAETREKALRKAVVEFLAAERAVEAEAKRAEATGTAWSSEPTARRIHAVEALRAALSQTKGEQAQERGGE